MRPASESIEARYRAAAAGYDASAQRTMRLRLRTIALLELGAGDTVIDVGCGTGLSFAPLLAAVGPSGRIVGVDASEDMLRIARARIAQARWDNVALVHGAVDTAVIDCAADAVLFNYTHDVMRSPAALARVFAHARAGARVAAAGIKHPPRWLDPLRLYRRFKSRACFVNPEGLDAPWDLLARHVPALAVEQTLLGTGYIAWGRHHPPEWPDGPACL